MQSEDFFIPLQSKNVIFTSKYILKMWFFMLKRKIDSYLFTFIAFTFRTNQIDQVSDVVEGLETGI